MCLRLGKVKNLLDTHGRSSTSLQDLLTPKEMSPEFSSWDAVRFCLARTNSEEVTVTTPSGQGIVGASFEMTGSSMNETVFVPESPCVSRPEQLTFWVQDREERIFWETKAG